MTTIVLDRDRFYGSALARVVPGQSSNGVRLITELGELPRLLAQYPEALVIVDEEAVGSVQELREVIEARPSAHFVVLVSTLRTTAIEYLLAGVDAIVHRPEAIRTIGPAVDSITHGMCSVPPRIIRLLLRHYQLGQHAEENEERLARLSPREREIVELLVSGLDPARVADVLDLSIHTVRSHLKRMFRKLEVHSTLEAVLVAVGAGVVPTDAVGADKGAHEADPGNGGGHPTPTSTYRR